MSDRVLWLNPAVGVAGDMLLASLLDLGADPAAVRSQLDLLPVPGWALTIDRVTRRGLTATAAHVTFPGHDDHRSWSTIDAMLRDAPLASPVRDGARATFERLARAEARVHGIEVDHVHFHEVGAVDAIVDVVGTWAALRSLGLPDVVSAPVGLGTGTASMAHGVVPVPAPATLDLLTGYPTVPVDVAGETATPTGVALLVTMAGSWGHLPAGTVEGVGRGAGSRDPDTHPNVVTAVLSSTQVLAGSSGTTTGVGPDGDGPDAVAAVLIETNVDDVTPEVIAHLLGRALEQGADDAWVVPITMKKGRPAHQLRLLGRPERAGDLRRLVAQETGTLGLRQWPVTKFELPRRRGVVTIDGHDIGIKVGPHGAKPEFDDTASAATALGRPVRDVARAALDRWAVDGADAAETVDRVDGAS